MNKRIYFDISESFAGSSSGGGLKGVAAQVAARIKSEKGTQTQTIDPPIEQEKPIAGDVNKDTKPIKSASEQAVVTPESTKENKVDNKDKDKTVESATEDTGLTESQKQHLEWLYSDEEKPVVAEKPKTPDINSPAVSTEKPVETQKTEPIKPQQVDPEISKKAESYDKLISNPVYKTIEAFISSGKTNVHEFMSEQFGEDYSKKSDNELYANELKAAGVSEEDIAEALEEFDDLKPYERKLKINPVRQRLEREREERVKSFTQNYKPSQEPGQEQSAINEQEKQRLAPILQRDMQKLNDITGKMTNSHWKGLLITPEMSKEIHEFAAQKASVLKDDHGRIIGFDVEDAIETAVLKLYHKKLLKTTAELAKTSAFDEFIKDRNRPARDNAASSQIPQGSTSEQRAKKATSNIVSGRRTIRLGQPEK